MSGKQVPDRMLAHAARAKGTCDDFSVCRAFWSFWAPKGHDITTTKRIYDCRLRVSCIKEYKRLFNVLSVLKRYSPYSLQVNPRFIGWLTSIVCVVWLPWSFFLILLVAVFYLLISCNSKLIPTFADRWHKLFAYGITGAVCAPFLDILFKRWLYWLYSET